MSQLLSEHVGNRDNNFNLIRFLAASLVLFSHSYPLALGDEKSEPVKEAVGLTMGWISVDIFFVTSGFLIAGSLYQRKSLIAFCWARFLRIFPALLVALTITVSVVGVYFTTLSTQDYFADRQTAVYFFKNLVLFFGEEARLPGVFADTPYQHKVNGSLWTLPFEVRSYALLVLFSLVLTSIPLFQQIYWRKWAYTFVAVAGVILYLLDSFLEVLPIWHISNEDLRLYSMFFIGSAFYIMREHIHMSGRLFTIAVVFLSVSTLDKDFFFVVYNLTLAYIVLYLAYVPGGFIRGYNRFGDYSYGVYIYAFPVQQSVMALAGSIGVATLSAIAFPITLVLAYLSWHLIEKRALRLKNQYSVLYRWLALGRTGQGVK